MLDNIWLDKSMSNYPKDVYKEVKVIVAQEPNVETVKLKDKNILLGPAFSLPAMVNDSKTDVLMLPFANVGKWYKNPEEKGDKNAARYSYAIWLNKYNE